MTAPESFPVYWLPKANDSRARQLGYLAKRNPRLAIAIGDAIMTAAARLAVDPDLSRIGRLAGAREYRVPDTPFIRKRCFRATLRGGVIASDDGLYG